MREIYFGIIPNNASDEITIHFYDIFASIEEEFGESTYGKIKFSKEEIYDKEVMLS